MVDLGRDCGNSGVNYQNTFSVCMKLIYTCIYCDVIKSPPFSLTLPLLCPITFPSQLHPFSLNPWSPFNTASMHVGSSLRVQAAYQGSHPPEQTFPSPSAISCQRLLIHDVMLTGLILCRFCTQSHSYCEFICATTLSCPENITFTVDVHFCLL